MSSSPPRIMERAAVKGETPTASSECWFGLCFLTQVSAFDLGISPWEPDSWSSYAKSHPLRGTRRDAASAYLPHVHSPMRGDIRVQQPQLLCSLMSPQDMIIYQCPTAQQNHKDNKALKPAVFHYLVAGFPQVPPNDPGGLSLVHSTAWVAATQACKGWASQ